MGRWIVFSLFLGPTVWAQSSEESLRYFQKLYEVAKSPRCANCHAGGETPLQTDLRIPHKMNITRNISRLGHRCTSCHSATGQNEKFFPPTAVNWNMPSKKKAFSKDMEPRYLCYQWRSPEHNAFEEGPKKGQGRSLKELYEHIQEDHLVKWSWSPGAGRSTPPGTHDEFVRNFHAWISSGAKCP